MGVDGIDELPGIDSDEFEELRTTVNDGVAEIEIGGEGHSN